MEFSNEDELIKQKKLDALGSAQETTGSGIDFWFGFHDTIVLIITAWSGGTIDPMFVFIIASFISIGLLIMFLKHLGKRGLIIGLVVVGVVFALMITNITLGF